MIENKMESLASESMLEKLFQPHSQSTQKSEHVEKIVVSNLDLHLAVNVTCAFTAFTCSTNRYLALNVPSIKCPHL